MRSFSILLGGGLTLALASAAASQTQTPASAVQARQAQYREIGTAFKAINDEMKKSAPGKFAMMSSARQIAANLRQVKTMFPEGSGPSSKLKMKALPAIWAKPAEFARLNNAAIVEADKLVVALRAPNSAAVPAQVKALGRTCQGCHQQFRSED